MFNLTCLTKKTNPNVNWTQSCLNDLHSVYCVQPISVSVSLLFVLLVLPFLRKITQSVLSAAPRIIKRETCCERIAHVRSHKHKCTNSLPCHILFLIHLSAPTVRALNCFVFLPAAFRLSSAGIIR